MANRPLTADIIANEALLVLTNNLGVLDTFYRAHEDEFDKRVNGYRIGDTLSIRRPVDYTIRSGATMNLQDAIEGKVTLQVNNQKGVDFQFASSDMTLKVSELSERFIQPAVINLVNEIVRDCLQAFYQQVYNWVGTAGEIVNSFSDFYKGPERLNEMAVPMDQRYTVLSPADEAGMLGNLTGLFIESEARNAYKQGRLPMVGGTDVYMSQVVATHTTGTRTNATPITAAASGDQAVTYDTVKDTWTMNLAVTGFGANATITAGDVFTIADVVMVNPKTKQPTNILQQFTVVEATAADGAGAVTLKIAPPIIGSGPHQTTSLTTGTFASNALVFFGTASTGYRANLSYHKTAFALAMVPMEVPQGAVNVSRQSKNGISVRVIPVYDGVNDTDKWRLDVLYGRRCIDPRVATRLSGT